MLLGHGLQAVPQDVFIFFQGSVDKLLQKPWQYKEQWVASVEVAMQQKRHHEYSTYLLEQCLMRRWLALE